MISINRFLPFVVPYADSVPLAVARKAISKAANLFCTQSLIWQEELPLMKAHPDAYAEIPVPSEQAVVVKIMEVSYNGIQLKNTTKDELKAHNMLDVGLLHGMPRFFYQDGTNTIRFVPVPEKHGVVRLTVAFAPTVDAKKVPDDLFDRFWPAIANGALSDIKQIQGQSYSDPQAALAYKELFAQGIREAKNEAVRSFGRGAGRVAYQRIV